MGRIREQVIAKRLSECEASNSSGLPVKHRPSDLADGMTTSPPRALSNAGRPVDSRAALRQPETDLSPLLVPGARVAHKTSSDILEAVSATIGALLDRPVPRATYRLQLNHKFTFRQAEAVAPYLASLGVSHVYVSPILKAVPGSMHGYDVVDYAALNPEIGTRSDFDAFVTTLHGLGLRLIVDFVPNHMGIENGQNAWWQDVLEHGSQSPYSQYFDIDWEPVKQEMWGKVLLPFLGDQYGAVLERGELKLGFERGEFRVGHWDRWFPISPST
ncbi:MAG: hypothetical protein H0W23_09675, partial [Chloroflexia bacterium]|nr:hypothetical protein [Chloroflexia bacterium]